jgi:hypothetical protein
VRDAVLQLWKGGGEEASMGGILQQVASVGDGCGEADWANMGALG